MNKQENVILSSTQLTFLLVGITIGFYFLKLPHVLVKIAAQDAWIAPIIGAIYPLYIVLLASFIIKKHPKDNILALSKKYLGNTLGSILNYIFLIQFIVYVGTITSDLIGASLVYTVGFMTPIKICIISTLIIIYSSYQGLKVLGKMNELLFYITIILLVISFLGLKFGSILNVMPFFDTEILKLLKASKETAYGYTHIEILLLIHPFVRNPKNASKSALISIAITAGIYTWIIFITIFYLGIETISKNVLSFLMVTESVQVSFINNFRSFFMFLWNLIIFKVITNEYYFATFILNDLIKIDRKKICLYLSPIVFYLSILFLNPVLKKQISEIVVPILVLYNILYVSLIALVIFVKTKFTSAYKQQN